MIKRLRRFTERRHDKLRLWILIAIGAIVPISLCWALPNMLADQRTNQQHIEATATQSAITAFRAAHPDYFDLCNSPEQQAATGSTPTSATILVLQSGGVSDWQIDVPTKWQPDPESEPSLLICLSMERSQTIDVCADGSQPDLSLFQPQTGAQNNPNAPQPQVNLSHYTTTATVYNLQTKELIVQETLYGGDPTYCTDSDGSLVGDRLTSATFQEWLTQVVQP